MCAEGWQQGLVCVWECDWGGWQHSSACLGCCCWTQNATPTPPPVTQPPTTTTTTTSPYSHDQKLLYVTIESEVREWIWWRSIYRRQQLYIYIYVLAPSLLRWGLLAWRRWVVLRDYCVWLYVYIPRPPYSGPHRRCSCLVQSLPTHNFSPLGLQSLSNLCDLHQPFIPFTQKYSCRNINTCNFSFLFLATKMFPGKRKELIVRCSTSSTCYFKAKGA